MRAHKGKFGNQSGAVFVTVALAIPLLVGLILYVSHMYRVFQERARMQELADAAVVGAASMQARSLNAIALLNDALLGIEGLAAGVFLAGNAAALTLDALVITAPEGIALHQEDFEITHQLSKVAGRVAKLQDAGVQIFGYTPLLAAQLPLLFENLSPRPLLLPFPLPAMDGALSLVVPTGTRGFGFENLLQNANDFAVAGAEKALQAAGGDIELDDGFDAAIAQCKKIVTAAGAVDKVNTLGSRAWGWVRNKKPKKKRRSGGDLVTGCRKVITAFGGDDPSAIVGKSLGKLLQPPAAPSPGGELLKAQTAFPPPLMLNQNYAEKYQIAVLAVRCKPWRACDGDDLKFSDFNFSIAQARAYSHTQREGGDLLIPDFAARLVPVTVLDVATETEKDGDGMSLQTFLEQAPWELKH